MHSAIYKMMFLSLAILLLGALGGCEQEDGENFRQSTGSALGQPSIEARQKLEMQGAGLVAQPEPEKVATVTAPQGISESDFIESVEKRDPFRPFEEVLMNTRDADKEIQREIKLEEYDITQLKLVAIITNIGDPRAMVVTPGGEGIVLRKGDYVGRADYVDPGSGADKIQINWKVHRINATGKEEERGVFLVRDDPLTPAEDDVTRFMPLYPRQ